MKKKQIQEAVHTHLSQGRSKSEVFQLMSGQGVSDRVVAYLIAAHPAPDLVRRHARLIDAMMVISWLQMAVAVLMGVVLGIGMHAGWIALLLVTALLGGFTYLFVWGFTRNRAWAYNATIMLSIINLPKLLGELPHAPVANGIALALNVVLIAFAWYVRGKVFPDFVFMSPRKRQGSYVFSS
jgi:hypothetical protein